MEEESRPFCSGSCCLSYSPLSSLLRRWSVFLSINLSCFLVSRRPIGGGSTHGRCGSSGARCRAGASDQRRASSGGVENGPRRRGRGGASRSSGHRRNPDHRRWLERREGRRHPRFILVCLACETANSSVCTEPTKKIQLFSDAYMSSKIGNLAVGSIMWVFWNQNPKAVWLFCFFPFFLPFFLSVGSRGC